jgi:uncharacterized protein YbaP (TraB family)
MLADMTSARNAGIPQPLLRSFFVLLLVAITSVSIINIPSGHAKERKLSLWFFEYGDARVYLLGSIHAMKAELYPLADPILDALRQADTVVFEIDLTKISSGEIASAMRKHGSYAYPKTIEGDLSLETSKVLSIYFASSELSFPKLKQMKPWYLMLTIGLWELKQAGFDPALGIDQYLQNLSEALGKQILELESFTEQIEILANYPIEIQDLSLRASLENLQDFEASLDLLLNAWREGDADGMLLLAQSDTEKYPELSAQLDELIDARNLKMADKIHEYVARSGTYLIVVGALHMGGKNGLVQLLGKKYKLHQLSY